MVFFKKSLIFIELSVFCFFAFAAVSAQELGTGVPSGNPISFGSVSAQELETGMISGKLLAEGGLPMSGGMVYFFSVDGPRPDPDKYWRVPDFTAEIKDNGEFFMKLPEGAFYIGAVKRLSGSTKNGPPLVGDLYFQGRSLDPKGNPKLFYVEKKKNLDIGTISNIKPFKGVVGTDTSSNTSIQGRVVTSDGAPVERAVVFAFLSLEMAQRPIFSSYRTDAAGRYILRVNQGGTYYLRAKDTYRGGQPEAGELVGVYGNNAPKSVSVVTGASTTGIDITVFKFQGRGPDSIDQ
jgi:hypothetical protein